MARAAIKLLQEKAMIRAVSVHSSQAIFTRATNTEAAEPEAKAPKGGKGKQ